MKITKRQLRGIVRKTLLENATADELRKIELLWWSDEAGGYSNRDQARMIINTLGVNPRLLKIWTIILPWGEIYEPWTFYGGPEEGEAGFRVDDVNRILDYFNSENEIQLTATFHNKTGHVELDTPSHLDQGTSYDISDGIEKAAFETAE